MVTDNTYPTEMKRIDDATIAVTWSDGLQQTLTAEMLRQACPCATCREKKTAPPPDPRQLPVISMEETVPLAIAAMKPVGNYAYQVTFSDGHDTGIFTFVLLRSLA